MTKPSSSTPPRPSHSSDSLNSSPHSAPPISLAPSASPTLPPLWLPKPYHLVSEEEEEGDQIYLISTLEGFDSELWDACVGETGSPFLSFNFLYGLERWGCIGIEKGWDSRYLLLVREDRLIGLTAAYVKSHSQGEFIFDWSWADAAHRVGLPYYPKLTVTSPFSPITSEKLIISSEEINSEERPQLQARLWQGLRKIAHYEQLTGVHALFLTSEETQVFETLGALTRHTIQFHWKNEGYRDFDEFLGRFRSKRRNQIKRERRCLSESGVQVIAYCGDEIQPEHIPLMYQFYRSTVEKYYSGNLYLNQAFFEHLYQHQRRDLCLLLAERDGVTLGGSFNFIRGGVLYGRYWGCSEEVPYLHFEVCAYRGIELCIERGWSRFEAGAGGGGHKFGRGFLPQVIRSSHDVYLPGFREALTELLTYERESIEQELDQIQGVVLKDFT